MVEPFVFAHSRMPLAAEKTSCMKNSLSGVHAACRFTVMLILISLVAAADELPKQSLATTVSELDGEKQPVLYWAPESASQQPTPLFVFLHSWSADYTQDNSKWMVECVRRNWIWIHPNFRWPLPDWLVAAVRFQQRNTDRNRNRLPHITRRVLHNDR